MDIEKLKDKLGDDYQALADHVAELASQRDAARKESIDGRKGLKAKVDELSAAQTRVLEKLGIDSLDDLDSLPDGKGQAEAVKQFEAKLKRLERDLADATKARDEISSKHRSALLDASLEKALSGHEWIDRDIAAMLVKNGVTWEEDQAFFQADGKAVPLADGVKYIAQTKPHLLKSTGAGGSGYQSSAGSTGKHSMTRNEFDALEPAARMAAAKEGVTIS